MTKRRITVTHDEDISSTVAMKYAKVVEGERYFISPDHRCMLITNRYSNIVASSELKKNGNVSIAVWRNNNG